MASERVRQRLIEQNPWWRDRAAINLDRHLLRAAQAPFTWAPPLIEQLDLSSPNVYTVRGPRQVGKTTAVKMLIRRLLDTGDAWPRILYYSLDLERSPDDIVEVVRQAKSMSPRETGPWRIVLDEVSLIPEWQRAVKYLRDQTDAIHDCFILTGSSAADIRRGAERLPGRRGSDPSPDRILLPLSFSQFCSVQGIPEHARSPLGVAGFLDPGSDDVLHEAMRYLPDLARSLDAYLRVGGFPRAIEDYLHRGEVSEGTVRILWDVLAGDIDRAGFDRLTALALLDHTVRALGSPSSFRDLSTEIGVGSPDTAHRYASVLGDAFALLVVYFWDPGRGRMALRKNKKLYLTDPLFGAIPTLIQPGGPGARAASMVEAVVGMALYRAAEPGLVEAFPSPQSLFYWHSKQKREIDFLSGTRTKKTAVEVKFQRRVTGSDKLAIRNSFRRGLILSAADLDLDDPVRVIPTPVFLWLLGLQA